MLPSLSMLPSLLLHVSKREQEIALFFFFQPLFASLLFFAQHIDSWDVLMVEGETVAYMTMPGMERNGIFLFDGIRDEDIPDVSLVELDMLAYKHGQIVRSRLVCKPRNRVRFINSLTNYFTFEDPDHPKLKESVKKPDVPYVEFHEKSLKVSSEVLQVSCPFVFPCLPHLSFG